MIKTQPPITIEARRDLYAFRFVIRSRRPANKRQPEQQATILRAAADQLRTWAEQMDDEASMITAADLGNEYHGRAPAKRRRGRRAYDVERAPELAHLEDSHATPTNP